MAPLFAPLVSICSGRLEGKDQGLRRNRIQPYSFVPDFLGDALDEADDGVLAGAVSGRAGETETALNG